MGLSLQEKNLHSGVNSFLSELTSPPPPPPAIFDKRVGSPKTIPVYLIFEIGQVIRIFRLIISTGNSYYNEVTNMHLPKLRKLYTSFIHVKVEKSIIIVIIIIINEGTVINRSVLMYGLLLFLTFFGCKLQSNFSGWNTFGTMKISSRQG